MSESQSQQAALKATPHHPTYRQHLKNHYALLGTVLANAGRYDESLSTIQSMLEAFPKEWDAVLRTINVLDARVGNIEDSEELSAAEKCLRMYDVYRRQESVLMDHAARLTLTAPERRELVQHRKSLSQDFK